MRKETLPASYFEEKELKQTQPVFLSSLSPCPHTGTFYIAILKASTELGILVCKMVF